MARRLSTHRSLVSVALLALLAGAPARCQVDLPGFERIAQVEVLPNGREVALPLPAGADPRDLRVVLTGTFACSYNGRSYDALHTTGGGARFDEPHEYVRWSPEMEVIDQDPSAHRYVLRLPPGDAPESVTAWVDVDRFVTDLIITPSEVRASLGGGLRMELWRAPRAADSLALISGLVAVLAALALAVVIAQRRAARGMADVEDSLRRIERKHATALRTTRDREWDSADLREHLQRLRDGARELAAQIAAFRRTAREVDRHRLDEEIAQAEEQLERSEREDVRAELQLALDAKRRLRDLVEDSAATQQRCLLRLSRIESAIEATTLWVTGQEGRIADRGADREALAALEQELAATDATIAELKAIEDPTGPTQPD